MHPNATTNTIETNNTVAKPIFTDIDTTNWSYPFITTLKNRNIINGYSDGRFGPNLPISRAEITKIALIAFRDIDAKYDNTATPYPDVKTGYWYTPFIAQASSIGIISGNSDGLFRPNRSVTRAEALKILLSGAELKSNATTTPFVDVSPNDWFAPFVALAAQKGIIGGYSERAANFKRKLVIGYTGSDVKQLQELLTQSGYYKGKITGYFGPITRYAVLRLQSDYPDTYLTDGWGDIGPATATKLFELAGYSSSNLVRQVFRPNQFITRAEASKIAVILLDLREQGYSTYIKPKSPTSAVATEISPTTDTNHIIKQPTRKNLTPTHASKPTSQSRTLRSVAIPKVTSTTSNKSNAVKTTPQKTVDQIKPYVWNNIKNFFNF